MNLRDLFARLNRFQQSRIFKIVASAIVLLLAIAALGTYYVAATAPGAAGASPSAAAAPTPDQPLTKPEDVARASAQAAERIAREVMTARLSPANVAIILAIFAGVALVVIWLGLGLTYVLLTLVVAAVAYPLAAAGAPGVATLLVFAIALTAALTALLQMLKLLLSGSGAVIAIARNVLMEAVRLKLSLVFIVMLVFAMAALPLVLDSSTPLRFRVQSFLQFSTGGAFWIMAVLTLFFSVGSVAFEQRDRQIWQTMTKPVAAWKYVLGKWLGVVALNAVLLTVALSGIFMFTEYLRRQPAEGELTRQVVGVAEGAQPLTPDRLILETQILTARDSRQPVMPMTRNSPEFLESVQAYIERNKAENPLFGSTPEMVEDIKKDLWQQARGLFRTIEPGQNRVFRFTGLEDAKRLGLPLTLRFRINAGGNRPDELYNVQFLFQGIPLPEQSVPPGTIRTITIPLPNLINPDGTAELMAVNGRLVRMNDAAGSLGVLPNADLMTFDIKEGLELSFKAGGFTGNLAKVGLVLWLKLAFLAMLGVCLATFLNFPVACLVAFSMFLAAESAGFLATSLEYYDALDPITREVSYWKIPVRMIGLAMSWLFGNYAALEPTTSLVDGKLITMLALSRGSVILIVFVAVLFTIATLVFSRRELATYSGH